MYLGQDKEFLKFLQTKKLNTVQWVVEVERERERERIIKLTFWTCDPLACFNWNIRHKSMLWHLKLWAQVREREQVDTLYCILCRVLLSIWYTHTIHHQRELNTHTMQPWNSIPSPVPVQSNTCLSGVVHALHTMHVHPLWGTWSYSLSRWHATWYSVRLTIQPPVVCSPQPCFDRTCRQFGPGGIGGCKVRGKEGKRERRRERESVSETKG